MAISKARAQMPARPDPRRARTREAILSAARKLFSEHYATGVSIDEISRTAGVSKQSFYNHFRDKDLLVREILLTLRSDWVALARSANAGESDPAKRLAIAMCIFGQRAAHDPSGARLFARLPLLDVTLDATLNESVAADVREALAKGRLAIFNIETGIAMMVASTQALISRISADDNPALAQTRCQQFATLVLRAFGLTAIEAELIASEAADRVFQRGQ